MQVAPPHSQVIFPHFGGPPLCVGKRRTHMANKRPKPEEIVTKSRQVEVLTGQGMPRLDAIRQIGVTEQTYFRWKKQFGGMGTDQLKDVKRHHKGIKTIGYARVSTTSQNLTGSSAHCGRKIATQSIERKRVPNLSRVGTSLSAPSMRSASTMCLSSQSGIASPAP